MEVFFFVLIIAVIILAVVIGRGNSDSLINSLGATSDHFKSDNTEDVTIEITMDVEYEGPEVPQVEVTEEEIEARVQQYAFVVDNKRPKQLKGTEAWYKQRNQNKFLKTEPERVYDWVLPFIPSSITRFENLKPNIERGPSLAHITMKDIRALIRSRRKEEEPYEDLLEAMYGLAVLIDFHDSLNVDLRHYEQASFVALCDLQNMPVNYQEIGHEQLKSPLKTDRKWFIENFGEPAHHRPVEEYFLEIRQGAISRSCWKGFSTVHSLKGPAAEIKASMSQWLRKEAESVIKWEKIAIAEHEQRAAKAPRRTIPISEAIKATQVPFVVADLETTGLNAHKHEITEIAAVLVNPDGVIASEFSSLVKTNNSIPARITELTGISDSLIRARGRELKEVLVDFLDYTDGCPVFFHNAPFDESFLKVACQANNLEFQNKVFDTLPIARKAWPSLGQYKLGTLAEYLELNQPNHRALQDARATLAVLLASRETLK